MAGTEAGLPYCFPGFAVHDELAELVGAGFTPMQALQAATREPARFLGLDHSLGTIEHGKVADLVVLDADPLLDIRNTQKIHALLVRGRFISTEQRQLMLSDVEAAARSATASTTPPACGCTPAAAARPTAGGAWGRTDSDA
jgi:adenine deaminase